MNFYSLYSSLDTGDNGYDPATSAVNQAYKYALNTDIPVAKAFNASVAADGTLTMLDGDGGAFSGLSPLVAGDVGCYITNLAAVTFKIDTVAVGGESATLLDSDGTAYSGGVIAVTAWALGGGDVHTISRTGTAVTRVAGPNFLEADVGKILFANSVEIHLVGWTNSDTMECAESGTLISQAATKDPVSRYWTDTTPDQDIRDRIGAWDLRSRLMDPLPYGDIGDIGFGFLFAANEGGDEVVYSELPDLYEELAGFYKADAQVTRLSDAIYAVEAMKNVVAVVCSSSTTSLLMNTVNTFEIADLGIAFSIVGGQNTVDRFVGSRARSSIVHTPRGYLMMVTSEPGIRAFDGSQYSANLAENRIMDQLKQLDPSKVVAYYDPYNGYIFWSYQEE